MHLKLFFLLCVAAFATASLLSDEEEWKKFKSAHNKAYETPAEEARRFEIFKGNLKNIREHNKKYAAGEVTSSQGVNKFSDQTTDEFKDKYTGGFIGKGK